MFEENSKTTAVNLAFFSYLIAEAMLSERERRIEKDGAE